MKRTDAEKFRRIAEAACAAFDVRQADVWDGVRRRSVVRARQCIAAALRETMRMKASDTEELMGLGQDTVRDMLRRNERALADPDYAARYKSILRAAHVED